MTGKEMDIQDIAGGLAPGIKAYCAGNGLTIMGCAWAWLGSSHEQLASIAVLVGLGITIYGFFESRRNRTKDD